MTSLGLFASTFMLVFALGIQSLNVNGGHKFAAVITSFFISGGNLLLYKLAPDASGWEIAAYMAGGPLGILAAIQYHPVMKKYWGKK